jgi:hypothetical protein
MSMTQTRLEAGKSRPAGCRSSLVLIINRTIYGVKPVRCDPEGALRAFRLNKSDGTLYDVAQTQYGNQCDCPDFIFRRDGLDPTGCKHVKALVAEGLLGEEQAGDPVAARR